MTDTPETDKHPLWHGEPAVHIDFARKMERERNKARHELKGAWEEVAEACNDWLDSIVQEASLEFIKGIRDYAEKRASES
jgi:hypothetical protein